MFAAGAVTSIVGGAHRNVLGGLPPGYQARWVLGDLSKIWQDNAGTTPVASNNDPVNKVEDVSGNGFHLYGSGAPGGIGATYKNTLGDSGTLGGCYLDASLDQRLYTASLINSSNQTTYYIWLKILAGDDATFLARADSTSGSAREYMYYASPPAGDALVTRGGFSSAGVVGQYPTAAYGLVCLTIDHNERHTYLDDMSTPTKSATNGLDMSLDNYLMLNAYYMNATAYGGTISVLEVILYDTAHSFSLRNRVRAYGTATYGTP